MLTAITRAVSRSLADCELTWLERESIDIGKARAQHPDAEREQERAEEAARERDLLRESQFAWCRLRRCSLRDLSVLCVSAVN